MVGSRLDLEQANKQLLSTLWKTIDQPQVTITAQSKPIFILPVNSDNHKITSHFKNISKTMLFKVINE